MSNYKALKLGDTINLKFNANIKEVCAKKGCWMTLPVGNEDENVMVRFKDYGFFMPTDAAGKEVIVDGFGWKYIPEKVGISEIWAIINKKGTFNQAHNHPGSYLSAAYYVKAPKDCGNIHFYEPNEVKKFHRPPIEKLTELSSSGFSIKPEEGNLLIFPSYLYHDVGKSLSEDDRIVISFNVSILPNKN